MRYSKKEIEEIINNLDDANLCLIRDALEAYDNEPKCDCDIEEVDNEYLKRQFFIFKREMECRGWDTEEEK